jgi:hypothetical protein
LSSVKVFFPAPFRFFLAWHFIVFSPFIELVFVFIVLRFPSSFLTLFYFCFFGSCGFISSLPQLAWDKKAWLWLWWASPTTLDHSIQAEGQELQEVLRLFKQTTT